MSNKEAYGLTDAIRACEELSNLPDQLDNKWKIDDCLKKISDIFLGLDEDDQERFQSIIKNFSSKKDLIKILSVIKGEECEEGASDVVDDWEIIEEWESTQEGIPDEVIEFREIRGEFDERLKDKILEMVKKYWWSLTKEHPENKKDKTIRVEFTIWWYHYKVLHVDGDIHSSWKYKLKNNWESSFRKETNVPEAYFKWISWPLEKWSNKRFRKYVEGKIKEWYETLNDKVFSLYLDDLWEEDGFEDESYRINVFEALALLNWVYISTSPLDTWNDDNYIGLECNGGVNDWFIQRCGGNVWVILLSRTKV